MVGHRHRIVRGLLLGYTLIAGRVDLLPSEVNAGFRLVPAESNSSSMPRQSDSEENFGRIV